MAKDIDQVDSKVKIGVDYNDLRTAMSEIQKGSEKATKNLKSLNDGYKSVINDTKQATSSITQTIKSAAKELKSLSIELKGMTTLTAGTKALKNQAALKGYKTNLLFGDTSAFKAQMDQVLLLQKEIIRNNTVIANSIQLKNVKYKESLHSIAGMKQANKAYLDRINYGTEEGLRLAELKRNYAKQKIIDDIKKYEGKLNPKETPRELTTLERAQAFRSGTYSSIGKGKVTSIDAAALKDLERMEGLDRRLGVIQLKLMANYKVINMVTGAFKYLLNYTVEYDKELRQLQAIAAVSDTTMLKLKDSIQSVASSTKFTSLEVAQAGTVLAQAGLSARQIEETLPAIAKLATATGTDLATSTDVITSTLNIYSLQASDAEQVTNALTTAMNESKADIAGFQKAIQYAGNYAAQLGVTYEETAAVISAATQAGIRSRSMLGTGMRAVLAEFLNPTKKLIAQLEKVGLTVDDIDIKSKGLTTVLKTLKESGFGATEAFRGMERRGAAFLASIINQTEFIDNLREQMAGSTAAAEANEVQMSSLSAQIDNFKSIAGSAAADGIAPLNKMLVALLKTINSFMSGGTSQGGKANIQGGLIMSAIFGATGALGVTTSLAMVGTSIASMANQIRNLEKAAKAKNVYKLLTFLSSWKGVGIIAVIGAVASAVGYAAEKFGLFTSEADKARATLEKLDGEYEEAKEKGDSVAAMLQRLYDQQGRLQDQANRDVFLREILNRFPEAAQFVDNLTPSFSKLEEVLVRLNSLESAKIAESSAKKATEMISENDKILKDYAKETFKFEEKNKGPFRTIRYSEDLDSMLKAMEESGKYSEFDFKALREKTEASGYAGSVTKNLNSVIDTIVEGLRSRFSGSGDISSISKALADLRNAASVTNNSSLQKITNIIAGEGSQQIKALIDENKNLINSVTEKYVSENTRVSEDYRNYNEKLAEDVKKLNEELKTSTTGKTESLIKNVKTWLEEYKKETDKLKDIDYLKDETGERRKLSSYSPEEFARFVGVDSTDPEAVGALQKDLDSFVKQYNGSSEEAHAAFADARGRTGLVSSINGKLDLIEQKLGMTPYSQQEFDKYTGKAYLKAVNEGYKNLYKAKTTKQAENTLSNVKLNARELLISELAQNVREPDTGPFRAELAKYSDLNLTKVSEAYRVAYGKDLATDKGALDVINTITSFNKSMLELDRDFNSVKDTLKDLSPEIPLVQSRMEEFFHQLNVDIKEIDMAYTEASRSKDRMLASQQGVITGLERIYGSGSVAVKAAQIRLSNMEKNQLGDRTNDLETQLAGYNKVLEALRNNDDYKQAKTIYDKANAKYEEAKKGGDQRGILQAYRELQNASKGWDKLATKEESLTSKIADLQDEITKNTEAINKEIEERRINTNGGNPFTQIRRGFGDAATSYIDEAERQGYGTLRGEAGIMGEGVINSLDDGLVTLLDNITTKSKTAKESFKEFGQSIIQTIGDIAKQLLAKQIVMSLLSGIGGPSGDGAVVESGGGWSSGWSASALGGLVTGPIKNRDSVPTMLMPGEYVLKKSAVDSLGRDYLDSLNNKSATVMAGYSSEVTEAKSETTETGTQNGKGVVNVYVVGQEQQQQMTPQDVVVTITQDMITGGQTKKLVKSIAMGAI